MYYSAVHVFGDSLVDAGNVLKLSEFVDDLPLGSLPEGTPTADKGYYDGRFTDGFTFADLISNKFVSFVTKPVFPFGYEDPFLGITFPGSDPEGNNLNFAYGGAQILGGGVPDFDDQTDAYKDAVDKHADPDALHLITIGGNDVRDLVPANGEIADAGTANTILQKAAIELAAEIRELIGIGGRHFVVTGIPDVGIIPNYNGLADEAARRAAASEYSALLDSLFQSQLASLRTAFPAVQLHFVSLVGATAAILDNLEQLYDPSLLYPLADSELLFFDHVHPTAQAHALLAASILDAIGGNSAGEAISLAAPDYQLDGAVANAGEVDRIVVSLSATASYTFELRGLSSGGGTLADPSLRLLSPGGSPAAADDDGGLGLDATLVFGPSQAGDHVIELAGVGSLSGSWGFQASADAPGNDTYLVSNSSALILERAGQGFDTVLASVSYVLGSAVSVEILATINDAGKASLNLVGNEVAQMISGNAGSNFIDGKAGSDSLRGNAGKDIFGFTSPLGPDNVDSILDYNVRDDTILLDNAVFAGLADGALARGAFITGTAAKRADDRIIYDAATGHLYFDPDGIGGVDQMHFATLASGLKVTANDFIVI